MLDFRWMHKCAVGIYGKIWESWKVVVSCKAYSKYCNTCDADDCCTCLGCCEYDSAPLECAAGMVYTNFDY